MIECDSCKEWFHGHCVGIPEESYSVNMYTGESLPYLCVACARIFNFFDPFTQEESADREEFEQIFKEKGFYDSLLRVFMHFWRPDITVLVAALKEGLQIPIFLEELQELKEMFFKIEDWKHRVERVLDIPLD